VKHRFYDKSKREQFNLQISIAAVAFVIVALAAVLAWISKIYLLAALIFFQVLGIFGPSPPGRALRCKSALVPRCGLSAAIAKAGSSVKHSSVFTKVPFR